METVEDVLDNCKEYVHILRTGEPRCMLIRGVTDQDVEISKKELSTERRIPKNLPQHIHDSVNERYNCLFGWPIRNGLFCYGVKGNYDKVRDLGYGKTHFVFPCGNFQFAYEPNQFDLYLHYYKMCKNTKNLSSETFLKSINYTDKNLNEAMSNLVFENQRTVEIIINCSAYYLINTSYSDEFIHLIWG